MSNNPETQNTENEEILSAEEQVESQPKAEQDNSLEAQIEALTESLEKAEQEAGIQKDNAIRAKAESENIRRRAEREVSNASKFALEKFSKEILAVVDSLEKALEGEPADDAQKAMREGIELTYKLLIDTLNKFSIEQISPLGDMFNPELHEAMVMQESNEHEPNSVMHVIQTGFSLNGRLIRPARVIVAKGSTPSIDQQA